jgi:glycosyltransferase involved in cell wall biosynthesis
MAKKRIAIVSPTFPPYRGGIGAVAASDARQLAALGYAVTAFAPAREGLKPGRRDGFDVRTLSPWLRYGNAALVPGAARLLASHDLVLLHYPFFGGAEPLWLAKLAQPKKGRLVAVYHMDVVGTGLLAPAFAAHSRLLMPRVLRAAERIIVTSTDYARSGALRSMATLTPSRFRELPPEVDVRRFSPGPKPPALLRRHGLTAEDPVVLMVGGLDRAHYFKGVPTLLAAFATGRLSEATAVVVGDGDLRPALQAMTKAAGLEERVLFAGGVSDEELPEYYRLADVFAFPSVDKSEAFGIVALEAAASGVPIVASDLPGVRTVVRHGENGVRVPPRSASALALALADMLADAPRRRAFGEAGRVMAEREYSSERRLARWKDILTEMKL